MNIDDIVKKLKKFPDIMELNHPITDIEIKRFQNTNGIELPNSYIELLKKFDGGEIFIPGTIIYGINTDVDNYNLKKINGKSIRENFNIPATLLIIGKTNDGDWLCINLNPKNEIIQWDHEQDEEFCRWENLEEWLTETIDEYVKYESSV